MHVVLAVPQVRVDPPRAALEEPPALAGEVGVAHVPRHLLGGAQGAEVPQAHLRVRAEVLDVHRVVLAALHDAVAVAVPAAGDPAELDGLADLRPQRAQERVVAGQLPVPVHLQHAAHLAVGGGLPELLRAPDRQGHAEAHEARLARGVAELDLAHRERERAEQERRRLLVVPHVRARAVAAAGGVRAALPAVEAAVGRAEAGLRAQRGEVEERGLPHLGRQVAAREGGDERGRAAVQLGDLGQRLLRDVPGVREPRGVVVADPVVRPGRVGLRGPRDAVGEVPGEEEERLARLPGGEVDRDRERGHRGVRGACRALVEAPVGEEVVPEVEERARPASLRPARAGRDQSVRGRDQGDRPPRRVLRVHLLRREEHSLRGGGAPGGVAVRGGPEDLRVALPVLLRLRPVHAHEVRERRADGRLDGLRRAIAELDAEDRDRKPARLRVRGHEGVHGLEVRLDGEVGVGEKHAAERVGRGEAGRPEAGQPCVRCRRAVASLELVRRERALEDARDRGPLRLPQAYGEEGRCRRGRDEALGGPVHELEVAQVAAPAERDRAGADAADRKRDACEVSGVVVPQRRPGGIAEDARHLFRDRGREGVGRGCRAQRGQATHAQPHRLHEAPPVEPPVAALISVHVPGSRPIRFPPPEAVKGRRRRA